MTNGQRLKSLQCPGGPVDVILDTDAFNEVDDQYAIAYLLKYQDRLHLQGICAAPFLNSRVSSAAEGMEKSYDEIFRILELADRKNISYLVYPGSDTFLPDEKTPVVSPAAQFMAELSRRYSPEKPLYIVAIGAITNVASALLLEPQMKENVVVVWLGGHGHHMSHTREFNMKQDVAAARVVFDCGVPLVQLPCKGVVDRFSTNRYELEHWLLGKNPLATYLAENTIRLAESYAAGKPWRRTIWDVVAVAWLLNDGDRFMESELRPSPIAEYDHHYRFDSSRHPVCYVTQVFPDALFEDLFEKLSAWG